MGIILVVRGPTESLMHQQHVKTSNRRDIITHTYFSLALFHINRHFLYAQHKRN